MIAYTQETFTKKGRVAAGAEPEKYVANQLTDESVSVESWDEFVKDFLEVCGNDKNAVRDAAVLGLNAYLKSVAGGTDNFTKAARQIVKLGLSGGKNVQEIAEGLRSGKIKF